LQRVYNGPFINNQDYTTTNNEVGINYTFKGDNMKRLFSLPKKLLVVGVVAASVLGLTAAVKAWGPDRPTFTVANPAPYVTFNSITDNPNYGDERTFYDVKNDANNNLGGFADRIKVQDGETLLLRTYVHNNAASNLNGTNFDGSGVAKNTKVRVFLPTATDVALRSNSYVSADNANPGTVNDTVDFYGDNAFSLEYVPGSAVEYTNAVPSGMKLSDSIVTTGAPVGYTSPNGIVPGCFEYTAIVTIKVKVKMPTPKYTITKQVAIPGQPWVESVNAKAGDTVSYLITVKNTGTATLNQVAVRDALPANMTIVPGTTTITNANNPSGVNAGTDGVVKNGIDVGSYQPGALVYVKFKATLAAEDKFACGTSKLVNTAFTHEGTNPTVSDTADVNVTRVCANVPTYSCDLFTIAKGDSRTVTVTGFNKSSANGATFKDVVVSWGDNTTPLTTTNPVGQKHQYAADGTYTISAVARFNVNGEVKSTNGAQCAQTVSFGTPTALPNTGPGDMAALFALVSVAGAVTHRLVLARRV
jgi:uncharacterized repeat protein (TIGR01451 family)